MRPEPLLLAFDTSAAHCAAVVLSGERVLAQAEEAMDKGQAERLMPLIAEVLVAAGVGLADLDAVAVGTGPGNFTGVRIAVAAARGLALALGRPAIGVSSFEALAYGSPRPVKVVMDARRGEVYVQRFGLVGAEAAAVMAAADMDLGGLPVVQVPRYPLAEAIARVALGRLGTVQPRPAPFYLRGADAAPPSDPPPVILP